jgi:uncharacterized membrane protein
VIVAYVNRADAPDWVKTHYRFQIRTFWIGGLNAFLSLLTAIIVVGVFFAIFTLIRYIVRCVKRLKLLADGAPYDQLATWLWQGATGPDATAFVQRAVMH